MNLNQKKNLTNLKMIVTVVLLLLLAMIIVLVLILMKIQAIFQIVIVMMTIVAVIQEVMMKIVKKEKKMNQVMEVELDLVLIHQWPLKNLQCSFKLQRINLIILINKNSCKMHLMKKRIFLKVTLNLLNKDNNKVVLKIQKRMLLKVDQNRFCKYF